VDASRTPRIERAIDEQATYPVARTVGSCFDWLAAQDEPIVPSEDQ
jgi:hypothetical protein